MTHSHTPLQFHGEDMANHSWCWGKKGIFATNRLTAAPSGYRSPNRKGLARVSASYGLNWFCLERSKCSLPPEGSLRVGGTPWLLIRGLARKTGSGFLPSSQRCLFGSGFMRAGRHPVLGHHLTLLTWMRKLRTGESDMTCPQLFGF